MTPLHYRKINPDFFHARLENSVGHFDGLHGTLSRGEGFPFFFNGTKPVMHEMTVGGIVAGETIDLRLGGGFDTTGPVGPTLRSSRCCATRIGEE